MDGFTGFELGVELLGRKARRMIAMAVLVVFVASPPARDVVVKWWVEHKAAQMLRDLSPVLPAPPRHPIGGPAAQDR